MFWPEFQGAGWQILGERRGVPGSALDETVSGYPDQRRLQARSAIYTNFRI